MAPGETRREDIPSEAPGDTQRRQGPAATPGPGTGRDLVLARLAGLSHSMAAAEWEALVGLTGSEVVATGSPWLAAACLPVGAASRHLLARLAFSHDVTVALTPPEGVPATELALDERRLAAILDAHFPHARSLCVRFDGLPVEGKRTRGASRAEATIGEIAGRVRPVELKDPDAVLAGQLWGERAWLGVRWVRINGGSFEERTAQNRPYFSPVSLHPRIARCVVNLAAVPQGGRVADPFCGTGGLLLEAGLMGLLVSGSDADPEMVEGTRATLAHWRLPADGLAACDIAEAPKRLGTGFDAVVADLPYGRSASTRKEGPVGVRERALPAMASMVRPGGRIVAGTSEPMATPPDAGLQLLGRHELRVHRSLTRHFHVWQKE